MDIQTAINEIIKARDLNKDDMETVMRSIMQGEATPAQIGGFLVGLRMKGETVTEITAAAKVMRGLATKVDINDPNLVDIVGTGGDGSNTFNISTTAAFVIAASGGKVAKHNNRSVSSNSGSADVLEAAGVNLNLSAQQVKTCVDKVGVGFMFAPNHHSAMKHAVGPRKELATRTIFNLLGPLTNPADAPNELMGVYRFNLVKPLAEVLQHLGANHVMVVHSNDGMDEISIADATNVAELKDGEIITYQITPEDFGLTKGNARTLEVTNAEESLAIMQSVLNNQPGPAKDIVLLNAGAAIYCANLAEDLQAGINQADQAISSGKAKEKLEALVELTQVMISE